jgi:hypothetical protein
MRPMLYRRLLCEENEDFKTYVNAPDNAGK